MKRVLLVGGIQEANLEGAYKRAFEKLGCDVSTFNIQQSLNRNCRLGKAGRIFARFVPVEPWVAKANREMLLHAIDFNPDLLLVIGGQPVRLGALSQFKVACPGVTALIWPDTMLNLSGTLQACLPLFDTVATYGKSSVPLMQALGAPHAFWLPLGANEDLHGPDPTKDETSSNYEADVSFIGGWRPEREAVLNRLTGFNLKIWGPEWNRRCKGNLPIMRAWQGRPLYGAEFGAAVRASRINLNIIDVTNFPSANMRFFEIPVSGGLQVASLCPEMSAAFRDGEHLFYYENPDELPDLVSSLLNDEERRRKVARAGHALVRKSHTYKHRASTLIHECEKMTRETAMAPRTSLIPAAEPE